MSYSNDQTQIRMGLVNYIGALLKSSPFPEKAAKQNVAAILSEETLKLSQDENNLMDLYVLKPMIKGIVYTFNQRINELSKLPKTSVIDDQVFKYKNIISDLEGIISMI